MTRFILGCVAVLFGLAIVSSFLEGKEETQEPAKEEQVKKEEKIEDIFEPSIRPREPLLHVMEGGARKVETRLDGVGLGTGKAFAVINGKIYLEGEEKEGIQVINIRRKEVDILMYGAPETLQLIRYEGLAGVRTAGPKEEKTQANPAHDGP